MRFAIFYRQDAISKQIQEELQTRLKQEGYIDDEEHPEYIFFIGGDGTFLRAVQHYLSSLSSLTFIGVKTGTLGFFYAYDQQELSLLIEDLKAQRVQFQQYDLLQAELYQKETLLDCVYAVNEIRLENPFKTMISKVYIDGEYLEEFRGNGLLVSSTLGSSAYNKSCGGALIDSRLSLLELTEIAPIHNTAYRSLRESFILDRDRFLTFRGDFENIVVGYDTELYHAQKAMTHITIQSAKQQIRLARKGFLKPIREAFIAIEKEEESKK